LRNLAKRQLAGRSQHHRFHGSIVFMIHAAAEVSTRLST
jgi:hypothetical protein